MKYWTMLWLMLFSGLEASYATQPSSATSSSPKVATFLDFPPYITDAEPGEGLLSVVVKESFQLAGLEPDYMLIPWRRSYRAVQIGEIDASYSWAISKEREREFHLSRPIFSISNRLLTTYRDVTKWQQLAEPRPDGAKPILCVPVGWKVAEEITALIEQEIIQRISPGHPRFCMELIRAARTNVIYMPHMTANYYLSRLQSSTPSANASTWPALYSIEVPSGLANTQHALFTRSAEGLLLKQKFDNGFEQLVASGRYREILETFLQAYPEQERAVIYREQINAGILPPE